MYVESQEIEPFPFPLLYFLSGFVFRKGRAIASCFDTKLTRLCHLFSKIETRYRSEWSKLVMS